MAFEIRIMAESVDQPQFAFALIIPNNKGRYELAEFRDENGYEPLGPGRDPMKHRTYTRARSACSRCREIGCNHREFPAAGRRSR